MRLGLCDLAHRTSLVLLFPIRRVVPRPGVHRYQKRGHTLHLTQAEGGTAGEGGGGGALVASLPTV